MRHNITIFRSQRLNSFGIFVDELASLAKGWHNSNEGITYAEMILHLNKFMDATVSNNITVNNGKYLLRRCLYKGDIDIQAVYWTMEDITNNASTELFKNATLEVEHILSNGKRVDVVVDGKVWIEYKWYTSAEKQMKSYLKSPEGKAALRKLPAEKISLYFKGSITDDNIDSFVNSKYSSIFL